MEEIIMTNDQIEKQRQLAYEQGFNDGTKSVMSRVEKQEVEDELYYEILPDILNCLTEDSKHNKSGEYGLAFQNKRLVIKFEIVE